MREVEILCNVHRKSVSEATTAQVLTRVTNSLKLIISHIYYLKIIASRVKKRVFKPSINMKAFDLGHDY